MSVPKLRFPEFRDAGEWEEKKLGKFIEIKGRIGYRGYTTEDIVPEGQGAISLSPSNITETGYISFKKATYISWFKYEESPEIMLEVGHTVLVKTGSSYGKVALVKELPKKTTINPQVVILKPIQINSFFLFLIASNISVQKQINETVVGGAIPTLSQDSISKFNVLIPNKEEQRKIADCLSSIDDRITAETQKLATLKAHKKGLMQQLFPAEGETLPKLRFPDFHDSGEWEVKKLEEVCDCIVPGRDKPKSFTGDIPWITIPDIQGLKVHSSINRLGLSVHEIKECGAKIVPKSSVIMSCVGTFGLVSICDQDLVINQQLHAWIPSPKVNNYYLAYSLILQKEQMERMATNTTIAYLNKSTCNAITIPLPSLPEQQKIVDCLSSLDEAIAAQTKKIATLKTHKKGLMQQLFPSV
jgi:type I restriction enzyme S subunit